jgi:hypothetical protein
MISDDDCGNKRAAVFASFLAFSCSWGYLHRLSATGFWIMIILTGITNE